MLLPLFCFRLGFDGENDILQVTGRVTAKLEADDLHHHVDHLDIQLGELIDSFFDEVDEELAAQEVVAVNIAQQKHDVDGRLGVLHELVFLSFIWKRFSYL